MEPNEKPVFELNMSGGPHPRSLPYFFGEGTPFLAFLQNLADKRSPDRFVELLASKLTYLFLRPFWIVDLNLTYSLLLFVSQLNSSLFSNSEYRCRPKHFIDERAMSMNDRVR